MDFQSEKSFGKLRLRAFQPYHQILCVSKHVEDVKDRSNTHKGCNAMYVKDVEDIKTSHNRCILKYVEDVEDRSNTHKGCNAMYVEDVKDGKRTYTHILAHNFLNTFFRIENPLSIKEVMSQNVCVCSFPIFDVFDIHGITALMCI